MDFEARKQAIREQEYQALAESTTPEPTGGARGAKRTGLVALVQARLERVAPPAAASSATSATATPPTPSESPSMSTSAASTPTSSENPTAWTMSPIGYVENGCGQNTLDLPSSPLAAAVQESLRRLVTGSNQPLEAVVQQICEYFVTEEDDRAEIGTVADVVEFYCTQMMLPESVGA